MNSLALDKITEEQIDEAAANLVTHMGWVQGRTPGMWVEADESLTLIDSGLPTDTFNVVCRARLSEGRVEKRVEKAVSHFKAVGRPFSWWVGPGDRPDTLGSALKDAGLMETETEAAMVADLNGFTVTDTLPHGLRIERARTPEQLRAFATVVAANWSPPDEAVLRFYEAAIPALLEPDCPLRLYVGYWNDEPVGSCELTLGGGVAGLYNVCTLETYRRRGIASALVGHCLREARDLGWGTAVLQASDAGQRVYARTGFHVTGHFREYKLPE